MSGQPSIAARLLTAALLFCAFAATVRAQEAQPQAAAMAAPSVSAEERDAQADERALAERRQKMIDECEQNHGSEIDCTRETDTELRAEGPRWGGYIVRLRPAAAR